MSVDTTPSRTGGSYRRWGLVLLLLAAATGIGFALDSRVSLTSHAMLYVLAVVVASYALDWLASLVCAVGGVTALNFFFVPPRWTLWVESAENVISLITMLVVALVISQLVAALRRETNHARRNERWARQLQVLAEQLAVQTQEADAIALGRDALAEAFDGPCWLGSVDAKGVLDPALNCDQNVRDGMNCCLKEAAVLGPGTGRWPGLDAWYLPLGVKGQMSGAVCVSHVHADDNDGREHAQALCALLAQTLWRLRLHISMVDAQGESARQQVQSTYLAAISHDLRTPLAAMVGAASALQSQRGKLSDSEQDRLLASMLNEAQYLSTVTENTLQFVRLSNATQDLHLEWESIEEIVGSVMARARHRDPSRRIKSRLPAELPLIRGDAVLLSQLLGNLLDNALKYSDDAIDLVVTVVNDEMQVAVKDRGNDIPPDKHETIFAPYSRNDRSGQRGAGLGLALCRAIAKAHDGTLLLRRRTGGGNSFVLSLPIDPHQPQGGSA